MEHPEFYPESSNTVEENLDQRFHEELENEGEEESCPLEQSLMSINELEQYLDSKIERVFWDWIPLELNQTIPGMFTAQLTNLEEQRHWQELLNGVVDMGTKLLKSYFFLIYISILHYFLTYIWFLCEL